MNVARIIFAPEKFSLLSEKEKIEEKQQKKCHIQIRDFRPFGIFGQMKQMIQKK